MKASSHKKLKEMSKLLSENQYELLDKAINLFSAFSNKEILEIKRLSDFDRYTQITLLDMCTILEMDRNQVVRKVPKELIEPYRNWQKKYRFPPEAVWNILVYLKVNDKISADRAARATRKIQRLFSIKALWEGMVDGSIL